jgi:DNA invertase Pin-like site-specific DNA recombinase
MKTTAIYVRVSTDRQAQAQTIDQQLERLKAHLETEGETLLAENIFRDDGYSGGSLNRPGLDQLRDRVRRSVLNRVIITSPDRLARNYVHQMVLIEELERAGCSVEFLDRPMSQDPHDQLLLQIRGAVAEYERVLIAERMRRGRQLRLRSGTMLPWTLPPYGYRSAPDCPRDPSSVHIEPAEGAIVRELFCPIPSGQRDSAQFGKASVGIGTAVSAWQATMERRISAWHSDQSGVHRKAVYWSDPIPPGTNPQIGHSPAGEAGAWTGCHTTRAVGNRRCSAGIDHTGGVRARAGKTRIEQEAGDTQQ